MRFAVEPDLPSLTELAFFRPPLAGIAGRAEEERQIAGLADHVAIAAIDDRDDGADVGA